MATTANGNGNLVDEFEEAFQACLNVLTKEETLHNMEKDEIRVEVDHTILRFIDLARQMEAFFLQKRFLLSALKPELIVKEDITELRHELVRKEELIKRHYEKIAVWQNLLSDLQGWAKSPAQGPAPSGLPNQGIAPGQSPHGAQPAQSPMGIMQQQQQQPQQTQQQQQQPVPQQQQQQPVPQPPQQPPQQGPTMSPVPQMSVPAANMAPHGMFMQGGPGPRGPFPGMNQPQGGLQGPLAYLEKTTSNIGMPDSRR